MDKVNLCSALSVKEEITRVLFAVQSLENWMRFLLISATFLQPRRIRDVVKRIFRQQNVTHFLLCDMRYIAFYTVDWPDSAMDKRNSSCSICRISFTPSSPCSKHTLYEHLICTKYHMSIQLFVNGNFRTGLKG